jgi:hypothetical protein
VNTFPVEAVRQDEREAWVAERKEMGIVYYLQLFQPLHVSSLHLQPPPSHPPTTLPTTFQEFPRAPEIRKSLWQPHSRAAFKMGDLTPPMHPRPFFTHSAHAHNLHSATFLPFFVLRRLSFITNAHIARTSFLFPQQGSQQTKGCVHPSEYAG